MSRALGLACIVAAVSVARPGGVVDATAAADSSAARTARSASVTEIPLQRLSPIAVYGPSGGVSLGEPIAVAVDQSGEAVVADGAPGRLIAFGAGGEKTLEFERPAAPGFHPTDLVRYGFFVYAIDDTERDLLRFDNQGAYRDVLLDFDQLDGMRRVSPYGMAIDAQGRLAITDVENHQVLLVTTYLTLDAAFGNYGAYPGQLDTPAGVAFDERGDIVVADSGNRRIQVFSDSGQLRLVVPVAGETNPLRGPRRVTVGPEGSFFVADPEAGRVFVFNRDGRIERELVPAGPEGRPEGRFQPTDLEILRDGRLFVTDAGARALYVFEVK